MNPSEVKSKLEGRRPKAIWRWPALLLTLMAGCSLLPPQQADPTRFYVLTAQPVKSEADATTGKKFAIGLRDVELPGYLRTRSLVVRVGANELAYRDYARWGEPLEQGLARVVRAQLASAPEVAQVVSLHGQDDRDRDVAIHIGNCEGQTDGTVLFTATWEISTTGAAAVVMARGQYAARGLKWNGRDYAELARRLSEASAGLGAEIAAALTR